MRCIGRGSYGEVWLARGVTGAWRAVKVVRREDFEHDRTFEREFQGILSFEPISRDHEGLVDILHVGRNVEEAFYFYVMELADDRESGTKINVVDYEPHTLSSDKVRKVKLTLDEVVGIGIALSDGLSHLHGQGLSHRDIKPSNIIFVQKRAKLADIGLVARAGQQTYVGTEGFVPPEGPGSSQADVYSLGMVLYEISTGKDRLCFPELPEELGDAKGRKRARMLNSVICKACDPASRRRFGSAKQLADALRLVRKGIYHRPILPRAVKIFVASSLVAFGLVAARTQALPWPPGAVATRLSNVAISNVIPRRNVGSVWLKTRPAGATVLLNGKVLGVTPCPLQNLPLGKAKFTFRLENYQPAELERAITPEGDDLADLVEIALFYAPPNSKKSWENAQGMKLEPKGAWHESAQPLTGVEYENLMSFSPAYMVPNTPYACLPMKEAAEFCEALLQADVEAGRLEKEAHFYRPMTVTLPNVEPPAEHAKDNIVFKVILQRREFGDLIVETDPLGASVYDGDQLLGKTPLTLANHQTGPFSFTAKLLGYDDLRLEGTLEKKETRRLTMPLTRSRLATLGMPFTNDLGMKFIPVGAGMLVSIWETRVKDYQAFTDATGAETHTVSWEQTPDHPVARVNRDQCVKFCQWLTDRDRAAGWLPSHLEYRLPTDEEWTLAAGFHERKADEPAERTKGAGAYYIWGLNVWPPPTEKGQQPGNFSDISRLKLGTDGKPIDKDAYAKRDRTLEKEKYDDGYAYTAPVGSFKDKNGIYDLAGNVAEWVSDKYGGDKYPDYGVTRGGSWDDGKDEKGQHPMLVASSRSAIKADSAADNTTGFRCVIAPLDSH